MASKKCNWCQDELSLDECNKRFCADCGSKCARECCRCHRPFPSIEKYFCLSSLRCNSCQQTYLKEKEKNKRKQRKARCWQAGNGPPFKKHSFFEMNSSARDGSTTFSGRIESDEEEEEEDEEQGEFNRPVEIEDEEEEEEEENATEEPPPKYRKRPTTKTNVFKKHFPKNLADAIEKSKVVPVVRPRKVPVKSLHPVVVVDADTQTVGKKRKQPDVDSSSVEVKASNDFKKAKKSLITAIIKYSDICTKYSPTKQAHISLGL